MRLIEIRVDGIRPGEKMHEVLVSEEECHHTWKRGCFYAIRSMLPELAARAPEDGPAVAREVSSADAVVDLPDVVALLRRNELLVDQLESSNGKSGLNGEELLR